MSETKRKGAPKHVSTKITLKGDQLEGEEAFNNFDFCIFDGPAGSGKTLTAVDVSIRLHRKMNKLKQYQKIWVLRPIVKNSIGYLPGKVEEKLEPWVFPIINNFNICQTKETTAKMMKESRLEVKAIDFMKGVTFRNCIVIVDEYQDLTLDEFTLIVNRLGKDSKLIMCGDPSQIDKSVGKRSCIYHLKALKNSEEIGYAIFREQHRHPIINIIRKYLNGSTVETY